MYKSSLRHIHDPVLLPLKVEVIFVMRTYVDARKHTFLPTNRRLIVELPSKMIYTTMHGSTNIKFKLTLLVMFHKGHVNGQSSTP